MKCNNGKIAEPIDANNGVRQGCVLSSDLFIIGINKAIKELKKTTQNGIQLTSAKRIQAILMVIL
jgi:hypothetical protein